MVRAASNSVLCNGAKGPVEAGSWDKPGSDAGFASLRLWSEVCWGSAEFGEPRSGREVESGWELSESSADWGAVSGGAGELGQATGGSPVQGCSGRGGAWLGFRWDRGWGDDEDSLFCNRWNIAPFTGLGLVCAFGVLWSRSSFAWSPWS